MIRHVMLKCHGLVRLLQLPTVDLQNNLLRKPNVRELNPGSVMSYIVV